MPLKVVQIRFEDPPVSFDAASEILSYIAYPIDENQRAKFAATLCRFSHLYQSRKDPRHGDMPHLIRPKHFETLGGIEAGEVYRGMELIRRRLPMAFSMLLPFLIARATGRNPKKVGGFEATVDNICQQIIEQNGVDASNNISNFKTRIWSPTRPVAHLAFALHFEVYNKRVNDVNKNDEDVLEILCPHPTDMLLMQVLGTAEAVRVWLPSLARVRFKEEDTIMFVPSGSGTL
jgi:hypothetical protein